MSQLLNQILRMALATLVLSVNSTCNLSPHTPTAPDETPDEQVEESLGTPPIDAEKISQIALGAATAVARAAAVTIPAKDLQPIFEAGLTPPTCPVLDAALVGRDLSLTIDYRDGCNSSYFLETPMGGNIRGVYYTAHNAFDLVLENIVVNRQTLTGAVSGRIDVTDGVRQTTLSIRATLQGTTIRGSVIAALGEQSMQMNGAEIIATDAGGLAFRIALIGVGIPIRSNPSLSPHEGSAQVVQESPNSTATTSIRFTAETPVTGQVIFESSTND